MVRGGSKSPGVGRLAVLWRGEIRRWQSPGASVVEVPAAETLTSLDFTKEREGSE